MLLGAVLVLGCSNGGGNAPTSPESDANPGELTAQSNHAETNRYLWGYWLVEINQGDFSSEILPVRSLSDHFNVLRFLEQGPCFDCFKLAGVTPNPDGTLNVNVQLRHPFPAMPFYTGFDVRGIAMFDGSKAFPVSGLVMSDSELGEGEIVNADAYTTLYNPDTIGHGLEGYIKGNYADIIPPNSTLNAYKRFASDDPANTRNAFYADDTVTIAYQLSMPQPPNEWRFGYAIDANWVPPTNTPVVDPMTDFPPEANCPEPWKMQLSMVTNHLFGTAGTAILNIDVFDRGGSETHYPPRLECPELFDGEIEASLIEENSDYARYEATITNEKHVDIGKYRCLVSVEDKENDPVAKPWLDLTSYQVITISPSSLIWAVRAGGEYANVGKAITTLSDNSTVVTGDFSKTAVFGPGDANETILVSADYDIDATGDIFVARYKTDGSLMWAKRAGGTYADAGTAITTLSDNSVVVTGGFRETAVFGQGEPNETVLISEAIGETICNMFIARYNPDGTLAWAKRAGGKDWVVGYGVTALSDDSTVVTGHFVDIEVFGPGEPNETILVSADYGINPNGDIFIARYNPDGTLAWAKRAGGISTDRGNAITALSDDSTVVTGWFCETAIFGLGELNETTLASAEWSDLFVARYNPDGTLAWAKRAGGTDHDEGLGITALSDDSIAVTGDFWETAVFGQGEPNETALVSKDNADIFIARYDPNGTLAWAIRAGGTSSEYPPGIAALSDNSTVITGHFGGTATFGEGEPNETALTCAGGHDIFIARYNPDGALTWARRAGGTGYDWAYGVTALSDNSTVMTGLFSETAIFCPDEPCETTLVSAGSFDIFIARYAP
jgi:uncharacterized delta-60 repeat protein